MLIAVTDSIDYSSHHALSVAIQTAPNQRQQPSRCTKSENSTRSHSKNNCGDFRNDDGITVRAGQHVSSPLCAQSGVRHYELRQTAAACCSPPSRRQQFLNWWSIYREPRLQSFSRPHPIPPCGADNNNNNGKRTTTLQSDRETSTTTYRESFVFLSILSLLLSFCNFAIVALYCLSASSSLSSFSSKLLLLLARKKCVSMLPEMHNSYAGENGRQHWQQERCADSSPAKVKLYSFSFSRRKRSTVRFIISAVTSFILLLSSNVIPTGMAIITSSFAAPVTNELQASKFLTRYGYLAPVPENSSRAFYSHDSIKAALKRFQQFYGLNATGTMDKSTVEAMNIPRCGVPDVNAADIMYARKQAYEDSKTRKDFFHPWAETIDTSLMANHHYHYASDDNATMNGNETSLNTISHTRPPLLNITIHEHGGFKLRKRRKRFSLQGSKWSTTALTYRISQYTMDLPKKLIDAEISQAFKVWSKHTALTFKQKNHGPVHIELMFAVGDHGDGQPFDGPGRTLAHAFFPQYGGDVHFDDAEVWTLNGFSGVNLLQTATHEIGHALGLEHSEVPGALMAPFYRGFRADLSLAKDDVAAIQALYGSSPPTAGGMNKPGWEYNKPNLGKHNNNNGGGGSVSNSAGGNGGDTGWRHVVNGGGQQQPPSSSATTNHDQHSSGGVVSQHRGESTSNSGGGGGGDIARKVHPTYEGQLPSIMVPRPGHTGPPVPDVCSHDKLDAVTMSNDGHTYVFKGEWYWKITEDGTEPGFPRKISEDWAGLPNDIDAALSWPDGKTYFFKDQRYWRFTNFQADYGYPKQIRDGFGGIPDNIDAAFVWGGNGKTYFIKGDQYWRYDRNSYPPVSPNYPRPLALWHGLPKKIDAAFRWRNGQTYFFSGRSYFRFNDRNFVVESGYPRLTSIWWFSCEVPTNTLHNNGGGGYHTRRSNHRNGHIAVHGGTGNGGGGSMWDFPFQASNSLPAIINPLGSLGTILGRRRRSVNN